FLHGISPAWIALGAAVICLMPFTGLIPFKDFQSRVNFPSAIYIAGILSIGPVLVSTGAGDVLGQAILSLVPFESGADFRNFMVLTGLGAATGMASTAPGVPAVLGPLVGELSAATGFSIPTVLMNQVIGYSTVILPYQVPPLILAIQLGGISMRDGARMTLAIAAVTFVVLTPLNYLWWQWLGYLN
ncbi:MAG: SLC13 family permease, partial [Rhodospirillales bacterium]|nr:SLC13 family permease [Rhodospirillales bacterium]